MSKKNKKIILLSQCLVNPYCRVHVLGQNFPLSHELLSFLLERRIGVIQYPCPETTAMGLKRNPQGREQYDSIFFRNHCKELLKIPMLMVKEFIRNGYHLCCFIGLENSPTCGVHWGKHRLNKYGTESLETDVAANSGEPLLRGIMAEIIAEELNRNSVNVPFLELPVKEDYASPKRKKFWDDLTEAVILQANGQKRKEVSDV